MSEISCFGHLIAGEARIKVGLQRSRRPSRLLCCERRFRFFYLLACKCVTLIELHARLSVVNLGGQRRS